MGHAQTMSIGGTLKDTAAKAPLANAVAIAMKIKDSVLAGFTRSDANGRFELKLALDTYQVVISHPGFGDQSYYVFGSSSNKAFDFGKIILPPKSLNLNEVIIYAYKDPIYYRGDTLIYTADSFKVKKNATVEDLLKKLPGIRVDAQGGITAQGKKVDQVLVDGDEFFGADPTIATKNLAATDVESVQVYDKKDDNAAANSDAENLKVMNLQLKEEAKKGYFGKITGASDFNQFYEGELLTNRFTSKRKISIFGLATNTPRSSFNFQDIFAYGLADWGDMDGDDGGGFYYSYTKTQEIGIPRTLKGGIYYSDKWSKKTKASINYSYDNGHLEANSDSRSQYFLEDTTYTTTTTSSNLKDNGLHTIDLKITQTLDSLTELKINSKTKYTLSTVNRSETSQFLSEENVLNRRTSISNFNDGSNYNSSNSLKLARTFKKKKDRKLSMNYNLLLTGTETEGILQAKNEYFTGQLNDSIDQKKTTNNAGVTHSGNITFVEPITKKIKLEFSGEGSFAETNQDKRTLDFFNGDYSSENLQYTNNFQNTKTSMAGGSRFTYEVKKQRFSIGFKYRQDAIGNTDLVSGQEISYTNNNFLPQVSYRYRFSDNKSLGMSYGTNSKQPDINQLQPVPDNSNTNQVRLGNPGLRPSYTHTGGIDFGSYKFTTGRSIWARVNYNLTENAFTNSVSYDTIGRTITQPVNVDGNYSFETRMGAETPIFKGWLKINPYLEASQYGNTNYINGQENLTVNRKYSGTLNVDKTTEKLELTLVAKYEYNDPTSTLNLSGSDPYSLQEYKAILKLDLPWKLKLESTGSYSMTEGRSEGYNLEYFILDASLAKKFLKNESLVISVNGYDILNQNINTMRNVQDNVITDIKTGVISRYILVKAVLKFNSKKTKAEDDEGMF